MKTIAFIDDEPEVLRGIERTFDLIDQEWEVEFFSDPQEVFERMAETPFDAVVTDMRMPGISGADVVDQLNEQFPNTARIVLSGQSSREATFRAIHPMHMYLPKPCEGDVMETTIDRALKLQEVLGDAKLKRFVANLDKLPSKPELYDRVCDEINSSDPSIRAVGEIIQEDVAMTAKILQLANSAKYGLRREVNDAVQAAIVLGMETIRDFVLAAGVAMQYANINLKGFDLDQYCDRSLVIARYARTIAEAHGAEKKTCDEAFTAGLLCGIGQLTLIQHSAEQYQSVLEQVESGEQSIGDIEQGVFGCNHANVGAFALGSWGLSHAVVEAIGFYRNPDWLRHRDILPVTAVHVASAFVDEDAGKIQSSKQVIDMAYLKSVHLEEELPKWRELCSS